MVRLAIFIIFCATVVGALMPAVTPGSASEAPAPLRVVQLNAAGGSGQTEEPGSGTIMLNRALDGHFYADAQVNGTLVHFLVDTGASGIALSSEDATRAGIALTGEPEIIGSGASGEVWGHFVRLNRVELGNQAVSETPAVVLAGGDRSLLGQSFLGQFGSVEIRGNTMVLR